MPANTGKFLPVSVFGVPNTGIPVSVYTGLETLVQVPVVRTKDRKKFEKRSKNVEKSDIYNIFLDISVCRSPTEARRPTC
jgi:hypothetical protein